MQTQAEQLSQLQTNDSSDSFKEWTFVILATLLIAFIIRLFIIAPIIVDGESMMPNLQNNDRVIVSMLSPIHRGDVIVFHAAAGRNLIKRVIGMPGDVIQTAGDTLYVNGQVVDEPYITVMKEIRKQEDKQYTSDFGPTVVPQDGYFVLGDNRPISLDSRKIGTISKSNVVGKASFLFYPFKDTKMIKGL